MSFRENEKREIPDGDNGQFFKFCGINMKQIEEETEAGKPFNYLYFASCFTDEMSAYFNGNNPIERENMLIHRKDGKIAVNHVFFVVNTP